MPRRYYRDDDAAAADFAAWAVLMTTMGMAALIKSLIPLPNAYNPVAPDNPEHVNPAMEQLQQLQLNAPKVDLGELKPPENLRDVQGWKNAFSKIKDVRVRPPDDNRAIVERKEEKFPFVYPEIVGQPQAFRIHAAREAGNPDASVHLVDKMSATCPRLVYEILADGRETVWRIADYEGRYPPQILIDHIRTYHPGAVVEKVDPSTVPARQYPFYRQLLVFGLTNEYAAPLPDFRDEKNSDPLAPLSRRMDFLNTDLEERVQYQLFTFAHSIEASNRGIKRLMRGAVRPTSGIIEDRNDPLSGFDLKLLNAKIDSRLYHTFVALTVESQDENRLAEIAQVAQDILSIRLPRYNAMQVVGPRNLKRAIEDADHASIAWFESMLALMVQTRKREWRLLLSVLSPQEIATLWHLPDETYAGEKIAWAVSNAPDALLKEGGDRVVIGEILRGGFSRPVSLAAADRAYHHYVAGKTGTGKSTLLHNLIHQDIAAGRGVAVIDPHGKLVDDILANSIPLERHQDVVLLDCSSDAYPVPLNPFRIPEGVDYDSAFNHVYWVLRRIYSDIWLDGRTDMVMRNVVEALLCDPEATPLDIRRLFTSDEYRQKLVELMQDHPSVSMDTLDYWEEFAERSKGDKRDIADPVITRTRAFLGNRTLELMTCHKHGLDYSRFIAEKKIVLARLNGRAIAQEVGSLGAMLISGLFLAAEAMAYTPSEADPRMFVYIDEVERFVTTPLPDMLAQARKFGLPLTLANQYLDQLSPETYRAIAGTVGTLTLFEMGLEDAAKFTRLLEPDVTQEALAQLGLYRMAVKTRAHGASVPAFIAAARRAPETRGTPYAETAAQGMTGVEVREWLKTRREKRSEKPDAKPDEPESGQVQAYE